MQRCHTFGRDTAGGSSATSEIGHALRGFVRGTGRLLRGQVVKRAGGPARRAGDRDVRRGAGAERRRYRHRRRGRAAARAIAPHRRRQDRGAQRGLAAGRGDLHAPRRAAGRPHQADAAAGDQRRPVEPRDAVQRVHQQLLEPAADSPAARCRRGDRGAGDRVADRRLFPGLRARQDLGVHPRRRGRGHRRRLHYLRLAREPDRLACRVRGARDPRVLPRPRAVAHGPGAVAGRPESPRAGGRRPRARGPGGLRAGAARRWPAAQDEAGGARARTRPRGKPPAQPGRFRTRSSCSTRTPGGCPLVARSATSSRSRRTC